MNLFCDNGHALAIYDFSICYVNTHPKYTCMVSTW